MTRVASRSGRPYIPAPSDPPDGYALVYNAVAKLWVPGDRTASGQELVHAANVTGTTQTISAASGAFSAITDITSVFITVPVSARPVWLIGELFLSQTVAGVGMANVFITETTSGSDVIVASKAAQLPNSTNSKGNGVGLPPVRLRLPSVVVPRTFKLQTRIGGVGTTPSVVVANASDAPSYLGALAA